MKTGKEGEERGGERKNECSASECADDWKDAENFLQTDRLRDVFAICFSQNLNFMVTLCAYIFDQSLGYKRGGKKNST